MDYREHALELPTFQAFRPTAFDSAGLGSEGKEAWRVLPVSENRDSGPLPCSNFAAACKMLESFTEADEPSASVETFGHWGPGWFSILVVNPDCAEAMEIAGEIACRLADYPVLDEEDFCEREDEVKRETWQNCYSPAERVQALRDNADSQGPWNSLSDLLGCVRGNYYPRNQRIEDSLLGC